MSRNWSANIYLVLKLDL